MELVAVFFHYFDLCCDSCGWRVCGVLAGVEVSYCCVVSQEVSRCCEFLCCYWCEDPGYEGIGAVVLFIDFVVEFLVGVGACD